MVERQLPKLHTRVRFPSPAPARNPTLPRRQPGTCLEIGMNVADWLRQIRLEQYIQLFAEQDISAEVLPHLTADDLKDLGIAVVGHRRRLLVAIEALRGAATPDDTRTPGSGSSVPSDAR